MSPTAAAHHCMLTKHRNARNAARRFDGHADYVRAAAVSPTAGDTWATGGYDHACKLWDARSGRCVMDLDHGAPIEDLQFFTSGALCTSLAVTAFGSGVCTGLTVYGPCHTSVAVFCLQ